MTPHYFFLLVVVAFAAETSIVPTAAPTAQGGEVQMAATWNATIANLSCASCGMAVVLAFDDQDSSGASAGLTWQLVQLPSRRLNTTAPPATMTAPTPFPALSVLLPGSSNTSSEGGPDRSAASDSPPAGAAEVTVVWAADLAQISGAGTCADTDAVCCLNISVPSAAAPSGQAPGLVAGLLTLSRHFCVYPAHPGVVRSGGSVAVTVGGGGGVPVTMVGAEMARVALPAAEEWSSPELFHIGQRGHMPTTVALLPAKPALRLQMGSYPSSQELVSQMAWACGRDRARV